MFKHSKESKLKIGKARLGKKLNADYIKSIIGKGNKPFIVYRNNIIIGEWLNLSKCARDLNLIRINIGRCLKGERKSHKGYTFKYKEVNNG